MGERGEVKATKAQIRNSNLEIRNKIEARMQKKGSHERKGVDAARLKEIIHSLTLVATIIRS
jgi:hypothetical protein